MTVTDNDAIFHGGGIFQGGDADLTINNSTVSLNTSSGGNGGGLYKEDGTGSVQISNSNISGNTGSQGGGVSVGISSLKQITDTDITGNHAIFNYCGNCTGGGGGLLNLAGDGLTITGGSISNNTSTASAGGAQLNNASITGIVISGNTAAGLAGGIDINEGSVTNVVITGNHAGLRTGGIEVGHATISYSVIKGNDTVGDAGGVRISHDGSVDHSEISGNTAGGDGGGVVIGGSTPVISNSTVSGNTASRGGGIFRTPLDVTEPNPGTATLSFVTIADNTGAEGANVFSDGTNGPIEVGSSIIANSIGGPDCNMALTSNDYNVEEGISCGFNQTNDVTGVDPLLGALANNGGDTQTRALGQNSPAINRVPPANCPSSDDDQRGTARPKGGACDSGAFESAFTSTRTGTPTSEPTPSPTPSGTPVVTQKIWGDNDCGDDVDTNDFLVLLAHAAGLPEPQGCFPAIDAVVTVDGTERHWGDINCDGQVNPPDTLALVLQEVQLDAGLPVGCPHAGDQVNVTA